MFDALAKRSDVAELTSDVATLEQVAPSCSREPWLGACGARPAQAKASALKVHTTWLVDRFTPWRSYQLCTRRSRGPLSLGWLLVG